MLMTELLLDQVLFSRVSRTTRNTRSSMFTVFTITAGLMARPGGRVAYC